jgi:hypothetical protein
VLWGGVTLNMSDVCCAVLQEDFEMSVAKVMKKDSDRNMSLKKLWK